MSELTTTLKKLVSENKTKEALMSLHDVIVENDDQSSEITVLTLLAEYNKLEMQNMRGTRSGEELGLANRKLNVQILDLISSYEKNGKIDHGILVRKRKKLSRNITILLAVLSVFFYSFYAIGWELYPPNKQINAFFMLIVNSQYAGTICLVALVLTLAIRAILNK